MPITVELTQLQLTLIIGALGAHADNLRFTALEEDCRELYETLLKVATTTNEEST